MKSIQTLAICDLNAAVAAIPPTNPTTTPGHTQRCLIAQFGMRIQNKPAVFCSGSDYIRFSDYTRIGIKGADALVDAFDTAVGDLASRGHLIAEIRRQLPMEVEVEIQ